MALHGSEPGDYWRCYTEALEINSDPPRHYKDETIQVSRGSQCARVCVLPIHLALLYSGMRTLIFSDAFAIRVKLTFELNKTKFSHLNISQ